MASKTKKMYRNTQNKKIAGVCSGIADYFGLDPTIVRIGWVILSLFWAGILLYIILWIIMPEYAGKSGNPRKLYRSTKDKKIAGVCGGIAEHLDADPTLVRLIWLFLFFTGAGFILYLILWLVMPKK